ncbi:DUF3769 domain-containing protein [Synechococcus sp. CS-1329]|uniref:DUF3769 domain-containing protein n=1 Tax=Synechococcus sp. CS-1329 TaxID=2847975 RepID=UPI00223B37D1|nr:DUF3769 domain-containing protein [Synechococcus sp. CS-1329]MCT0219064.1 DUF3769 domain-containing protein [Synechococcus sp. CS-1329]
MGAATLATPALSRAQDLGSESPPARQAEADLSDSEPSAPEAQPTQPAEGAGPASAAPARSEAATTSPAAATQQPSAPIASPAEAPGPALPGVEPAGGQPPGPAGAREAVPAGTPSTIPPKELKISADQQGFDVVINRFVASGNVKAVLAGGRLMADRLEYDTTTRTLYATGSVRFWRGRQYVQGSLLRYGLIEGEGEMEDVYGVLDLETSLEDLDVEQPASLPLPKPEPIACPTVLPEIPDWHPHPWSATLWGGQMFHSDFGETFFGQGVFRPERVLGVGLQKRLIKAGPFALELDFNALGHWASAQRGGRFTGPFSSSEVANLSTSAQTFGEFTGGIGLRAWLQPWLSLGFVQGVSLNTNLSNYEDTYRERSARLLNYLGFEIEGSLSPQWSMVGRIHHRSGAFGTYNGVREGSNAYLLGLRYHFGGDPPPQEDPQATLRPAKGCPNRGAEPPERPRSLPEALEQTAMGGEAPLPAAEPPSLPAATTAAADRPTSFRAMREQERQRAAAAAAIEQRISDVQQREGLQIERRRGTGTSNDVATDQDSDFGPSLPPQVRRLRSENNRQAVQGTLTHLRYQAARIVLTADGWRSDRASFSNDPFTPSQSWMDADQVVVKQDDNGDLLITSKRNRLILEDRLPIPVTSSTRISKQQEVENRWVLGVDQEDRDGFYVGRRLRPIRIGQKGILELEPQFMLERAYQGTTDSYPIPGGQAGGPSVSQDNTLGDLFGLEARLETPLLGFNTSLNLDISTFNPENLANGTRSWGQMNRNINLPLVGATTARLFGAYRFRIWNGSLGEQDIYSAYGVSLEQKETLPKWGRLSNRYFWRVGVGNYQSNEFLSSGEESRNLAQLWRANAVASLNSSLQLWRGRALPSTPDGALRYSPEPIVPGLALNTNLTGNLAYFGDGTYQNTFSISGGPTLTLGHFNKRFFDFTQLTITGGITLRDGLSPFGFDAAVDLGTVGIGLTQQIAGPLLFNGGIGLNVDPSSPNYGELTGSYVELRWQRRAYAFSVFYSPFEGIGGVRIRLNDFSFKGTGVPFAPYRPEFDAVGGPRQTLF